MLVAPGIELTFVRPGKQILAQKITAALLSGIALLV